MSLCAAAIKKAQAAEAKAGRKQRQEVLLLSLMQSQQATRRMQRQISSSMQPCKGSLGVVSMHTVQHSLLAGTNVPIGRRSCLTDDLKAVDWMAGLHHAVSHGSCWPAGLPLPASMFVMVVLQPSMQAAADTSSSHGIICCCEGPFRALPWPCCLFLAPTHDL